MTQEQRRLALLQKQKERRAQQLSRWRGEVSSETDGATSDEASRAGAMDTGTVDGSAAGGAACEARAYAGRLMRGELMDAIPSDLSDFVAVPCPPGRQVLVVAGAGRTVGYTRTGYQCLACPSELPGGGARGKRTPHEHTVLDCILDESSKTLYAVDIITWNGYPTDNTETTFRQWWLQSKLSEDAPTIQTRRSDNPYAIVPLVVHPTASLATTLPADTDGVLFVHSESSYEPGLTPCALWLPRDRIPSLLSAL